MFYLIFYVMFEMRISFLSCIDWYISTDWRFFYPAFVTWTRKNKIWEFILPLQPITSLKISLPQSIGDCGVYPMAPVCFTKHRTHKGIPRCPLTRSHQLISLSTYISYERLRSIQYWTFKQKQVYWLQVVLGIVLKHIPKVTKSFRILLHPLLY